MMRRGSIFEELLGIDMSGPEACHVGSASEDRPR